MLLSYCKYNENFPIIQKMGTAHYSTKTVPKNCNKVIKGCVMFLYNRQASNLKPYKHKYFKLFPYGSESNGAATGATRKPMFSCMCLFVICEQW